MSEESRELSALLRAERRKLHVVQEISRALASTLDVDDLLARIMEQVTLLMEADRSTLYLVAADGTGLWSKISQGDEVREIRLAMGEGVAGWAAKTGEIVSIPDAYADPRFHADVDRRSGYRTTSILCMPLASKQGECLGAIQVLNKNGPPGTTFSSEDEALLEALGSQISVAIENAKLYAEVVDKNRELISTHRELAQKTEDLNVLFTVEAEMNAALTLDEAFDRLLARAMQLVGARAGSILLREEPSGVLHFRAVSGAAGAQLRHVQLMPGEGIAGWVAEHQEPLAVNSPADDPRHKAALALQIGYAPKQIVCVPLVAPGDEILGVIELLDAVSESGFLEADTKLLSLIAGQASKAIQLSRAREQRAKEERLAAVGQLVSGVLHDLKTPMTIVSGYAQLMVACESADERGKFGELIVRQFEQMSAMTREVLAFARGESTLLVRKVYLHQFLADVRAYLEQLFQERKISLSVDLRYTGIAYFDELKLLRVVHNLARNAAQAMGPGGHFRLLCDRDGDDLVFEFSDDGPGIPADVQSRMFELFTTSGKPDGTGLGLPIVKRIVEEHRGSITWDSSPSKGTTFRVKLPLARPLGMGESGPIIR